MKVLCKKTYSTIEHIDRLIGRGDFKFFVYYEKNKYYNVEYYTFNKTESVRVYYDDKKCFISFKIVDFEKYFYTQKELRKIKLNQINETAL